MIIRNMNVNTISATNPACSEYLPGEWSPNPLAARPLLTRSKPTCAAGNKIDDPRSNNRPDHLGNDVRDHIRGGKTSPNTQANGDRGIQVTARNMTNSIGHSQHGEAKGQRYSVEPDTQIPIPEGNAAARTALPQPPKTNQKVPMSSATARCASGIRPPLSGNTRILCQPLPGSETHVREPSLCSVDNVPQSP